MNNISNVNNMQNHVNKQIDYSNKNSRPINIQKADSLSFQGTDSNNKKLKNPSFWATLFGTGVGILAGITSSIPILSIASIPFQKQIKNCNNLAKDECSNITATFNEALTKTGLDKKGVKFLNLTPDTANDVISQIVEEIFANNKTSKLKPQEIENNKRFTKNILNVFYAGDINGKNAHFISKINKIVLNKDKMSLAFFHEVGHAMNKNLSKFGKNRITIGTISVGLSISILLASLFKTKKAEGEKPEGKFDKTTTFIKNNAGKLTFATFLPMLIEEGTATLKGNKLAKGLLSPELAQKVRKFNGSAFLTYMGLATGASLSVYLANKVKDKIAHQKIVDTNEPIAA